MMGEAEEHDWWSYLLFATKWLVPFTFKKKKKEVAPVLTSILPQLTKQVAPFIE